MYIYIYRYTHTYVCNLYIYINLEIVGGVKLDTALASVIFQFVVFCVFFQVLQPTLSSSSQPFKNCIYLGPFKNLLFIYLLLYKNYICLIIYLFIYLF